MDARKIKSALIDITAERDPTLKSAKLASLCSALWAERGVVSVYPGENQAARECAKALAAVALRNEIAMNWDEVRRLANLPEYRNFPECVQLANEVADELKVKSPLHPD